jgi:hypothetical protein
VETNILLTIRNKTLMEKKKGGGKPKKQRNVTEQKPKSKIALYWDSRKKTGPGLEIVDMKAVLR